MADDNNAKKRPRRGPAWAYVIGGALGLPFIVGFSLGLFHMHLADTGTPPTTVAIAGAALGYVLYRILSKPAPPARPSDLDV